MGNVHMEATQINYREGDKKMSVAQAIKNAGNTGLAHTADIAPEFRTDSAYSAGDFVYHNGSLYEFTANHAAGAWSTDDTQAATVGGKITSLEGDVSNLNDIKANQITIAPAFSAEASYDPGDIVYYNGLSYRCVNAHQGEWDADDFAATTISNELASLMSGLTNLNSFINKRVAFRGTLTDDVLDIIAGLENDTVTFFYNSNNPANAPSGGKWGAYLILKASDHTGIIYFDGTIIATASNVADTATSITWGVHS